MPDELDGDLLRRFVQGDRDAFESLFKQFEADVYRWILRTVRDATTAEDALVEAFWRAYRGRARFDSSRSFGAWMRRIATNVARDQRAEAWRGPRRIVTWRCRPVQTAASANRSGSRLAGYRPGCRLSRRSRSSKSCPTRRLPMRSICRSARSNRASFAPRARYLEVPSQFVFGLPARPLVRAIVFPMAVVPNLWGAWNMLHVAAPTRWRLPIGTHGALLPLLLIPAGVMLARAFDVFTIQLRFALPVVPIGMAVYYLVWKHLVGFLNDEMGIA